MAKRKYSSRRKKSNSTGVRKWLFSTSWILLVLVVLYFIGKYAVNELAAEQKAEEAKVEQQAEKIEGLEMVVIPDGMTNEVHQYKGFTTYFNKDKHVPNCVVYELTREETKGNFPRAKNFLPDPNMNGTAKPQDYTNSGYDRGHMAPAGDMKWDRDAMQETFYMTNIAPQVKILNTGKWSKLENKMRDWAYRDSAIIIVTGPIWGEGRPKTIGTTMVAVPEAFFKVVLAPYTHPMRAIAFVYPNDECKGGLKYYAKSVDDVERMTGLDFFSSLPDAQEKEVESTFDLNQWEQRNEK